MHSPTYYIGKRSYLTSTLLGLPDGRIIRQVPHLVYWQTGHILLQKSILTTTLCSLPIDKILVQATYSAPLASRFHQTDTLAWYHDGMSASQLTLVILVIKENSAKPTSLSSVLDNEVLVCPLQRTNKALHNSNRSARGNMKWSADGGKRISRRIPIVISFFVREPRTQGVNID